MASIDLSDLIPDLVSEVNVPGSDAFPEATNSDWLIKLKNAFWQTVYDGLISGYEEEDGIVSPVTGTTTLSREAQQLVILYATINTVRLNLLNAKSSAKYKAGPVEYETAMQGASVLKTMLDALEDRRKYLLVRLGDTINSATDTYYIDAYEARQEAINYQITTWIGN